MYFPYQHRWLITKKLIISGAILLITGFIAGFVAGTIFYVSFVEKKTFETYSAKNIVSPYVYLTLLRKDRQGEAVKQLEMELECGLLSVAVYYDGADRMPEITRDALRQIKLYLEKYPIQYINPESKDKIEKLFEKTVPEKN